MHDIAFSAAHEAEGRNRLTVFFRGLMIIPLAIVSMFYGFAAFIGVFFAWFALLFTGRYPEGLYNFVSGYNRFIARMSGYMWLLADEYPPFDGGTHTDYPVQLAIGPPKPEYSRAKVFFRIVLVIPVYIFLYIHQLIYYIFGFISWFAILFTGKLAEGLYSPLRASIGYQAKATAYMTLLSEDWPSFWTTEIEEQPAVAAINAGSTAALPGESAASVDSALEQ